MKFKTFRCLAALVALVVLSGVCVSGAMVLGLLGFSGSEDPMITTLPDGVSSTPSPTPTKGVPIPPDETTPPPAPTTAAPRFVDAGPLRPMDNAILAQVKSGFSGSKLKDALPHKSWKANIYKDSASVYRVKIDLDRDESWDEKWTIDGEEVSRKVSSPDDDKTYDYAFTRKADQWLAVAAPAAPERTSPPPTPTPTTTTRAPGERPTPTSPPAAGDAQRSLDIKILGLAQKGISGSKQKDAFSGQAWKVNLYADGGRVTRLKLDLDRDEKWDEKWTFETPGQVSTVKRLVAPNDDEAYTVEYRLRAGRWVKK